MLGKTQRLAICYALFSNAFHTNCSTSQFESRSPRDINIPSCLPRRQSSANYFTYLSIRNESDTSSRRKHILFSFFLSPGDVILTVVTRLSREKDRTLRKIAGKDTTRSNRATRLISIPPSSRASTNWSTKWGLIRGMISRQRALRCPNFRPARWNRGLVCLLEEGVDNWTGCRGKSFLPSAALPLRVIFGEIFGRITVLFDINRRARLVRWFLKYLADENDIQRAWVKRTNRFELLIV